MVTNSKDTKAVNDEISGGIGPVNWLFCSIVTSTKNKCQRYTSVSTDGYV